MNGDICVLTDCRTDTEICKAMLGYADRIIKLPPFPRLAEPVCAHTDMLLFAHEERIYTWEEYRFIASEIFSELESMGYEVICISEEASDKYPYDIRLNCAAVGDAVIANTRHISASLLRLAEQRQLRLVHTNQGYAKCSCAVISENAIITADSSIYASAVSQGIDALRIREGYVRLDGYNTGFIGGATCTFGDLVFFCGDLYSHPDAEKIEEFCLAHKKTPVSLGKKSLYDYGTPLFLQKMKIR